MNFLRFLKKISVDYFGFTHFGNLKPCTIEWDIPQSLTFFLSTEFDMARSENGSLNFVLI